MNESLNSLTPSKNPQLVRFLAEQGYRLFSQKEARDVAIQNSLEITNMTRTLVLLKAQGWIHSLKRDLYVLDSVLIGGQPIHEFEIATRLVTPCAISHLSAFHFHELTDQIPQIVFATTLTHASVPRTPRGELFTCQGVRYHYSQVREPHFFGIEKVWVGDVQISITDLERTLLDGLIKPKNCGGFMEVLSAYRSLNELNLSKLIDYALRLDVSVAKRLGWILEQVGTEDETLASLMALPFAGFIKLDASGEKKGPYNHRWQIQENI